MSSDGWIGGLSVAPRAFAWHNPLNRMKISTAAMLFAASLAVLAVGCSSTESKDPGPGTPAPATTAPPVADPPADTTPVVDTAAAATLKAPKIDGIMKMGGVLHVSWTNAEASSDAVELERKTATAPYKVVYTLPGDVDNKMDNGASAATMYTYRARCKKGATYSAYSNEKSATP